MSKQLLKDAFPDMLILAPLLILLALVIRTGISTSRECAAWIATVDGARRFLGTGVECAAVMRDGSIRVPVPPKP